MDLLLGSQGQRRGHDLDSRNAVGDQRLPVVDVEAVQIVDGVQNRIHRLGLGDEADHAGIQVEIGQQHFLILPAQLGGHVATSVVAPHPPLAEKNAKLLPPPLAPASRRRLRSAERFSSARRSGLLERRIEIFVDAGAHGSENRVRVGGGVQRDDHGVADGAPDGGHQALQRLSPAADIDQHDIRPHALQAVQEIADIADVLVFDNDAERQIGKARLRLLPELPVFDGQPDGQRIHCGSPVLNLKAGSPRTR